MTDMGPPQVYRTHPKNLEELMTEIVSKPNTGEEEVDP